MQQQRKLAATACKEARVGRNVQDARVAPQLGDRRALRLQLGGIEVDQVGYRGAYNGVHSL